MPEMTMSERQQIVSSFKNWKAIANYAHRNPQLMLALITLDHQESPGLIINLGKVGQDCLTDHPQSKVPLSALQRHAGEEAAHKRTEDDDCNSGPDNTFLESYEALLRYHIPFVTFGLTAEAVRIMHVPGLPLDISSDAQFGQVVEWLGHKWFVAERNENPGVHLLTLALLECVDLDA